MSLEVNWKELAMPSVDSTSTTQPIKFHPGMTKDEYFLAHVVQGLVMTGESVDTIATSANKIMNALKGIETEKKYDTWQKKK